MLRNALAGSLLIVSANVLIAQEHAHTPGMTHPSASDSLMPAPVSPGQAAYAAIAEVARLLQADPTTDWRKVDLERLRQHLIDMDAVTMRASVRKEHVAGGARFLVTGTDRTVDAIRRMTRAHGGTMRADGMAVTVASVTRRCGALGRVTLFRFRQKSRRLSHPRLPPISNSVRRKSSQADATRPWGRGNRGEWRSGRGP